MWSAGGALLPLFREFTTRKSCAFSPESRRTRLMFLPRIASARGSPLPLGAVPRILSRN